MSFEAAIETDLGERVLLRREDGMLAGNALVAFLSNLDLYCLDNTASFPEMRRWFVKLDHATTQSLCDLSKPLRKGYYAGNWAYQEHEYEQFSRDSRDMPLSEKEFLQAIQEINEIWVDVIDFQKATDSLISLLIKADLTATEWYEPRDILADFLALKDAVKLVNRGPECKMRIQFT